MRATSSKRPPNGKLINFPLLFTVSLVLIVSGCFHSDDDKSDYQQGNIESKSITLNFSLSGLHEAPPNNTNYSGSAEIEINKETGAISGFAQTNISNASMAHIHRGFAGMNGPVIVSLIANGGQWEIPDDTVLSEDELQAFFKGELYLNVHSEDQPLGALRGQLLPDDIKVIYVSLTGNQEVPPETTIATANAALTINADNRSVTLHAMTTNLDDAAAAHIHQGIAGANGLVEFPLSQAEEDSSHWMLNTTTFSQAQLDQLLAAALYINIHSPDFPAGEVRGQIVPDTIIELPTLQIISQTPSANASLNSLPAEMVLDFNSELNGDTIVEGAFSLVRSGGDNTFDEGNEVAVNIGSAQLAENNSSNVILDIDGNESTDDLYQLTVSDTVRSTEGRLLDGDADGSAGGNYKTTFIIDSGSDELKVSFSSINETLSTTCAKSNCHSGGSPAAGMNLSEGQAYDNIVNISSSEMPNQMRIEPGNPDDSYLIQKLEGTAAVGARMPYGGPYLSQQEIDGIRQWIKDGALNN